MEEVRVVTSRPLTKDSFVDIIHGGTVGTLLLNLIKMKRDKIEFSCLQLVATQLRADILRCIQIDAIEKIFHLFIQFQWEKLNLLIFLLICWNFPKYLLFSH